MTRKILAPHKEQDGYAYYRLPNSNLSRRVFIRAMEIIGLGRGMDEPWYPDDAPNQRIISSRRVEEAVETADFLKLCDEEGLHASFWGHNSTSPWIISDVAGIEDTISSGTTLREAYYRFKAQTEEQSADDEQPIESEPMDDERLCDDCEHFHKPCRSEPCSSCIDHKYESSGDWSRPYFERAAR